MPPPPTLDAALEERFLSWMHRVHPELVEPTLLEDLRRLVELDGLVLDGAAFAHRLVAADVPDDLADRLVRLDAAWSQFRRTELAADEGELAWVGRPGSTGEPADDDIVWIDPGEASALRPPSGPAPSLLPRGARPRRPGRRRRRPRLRLSDLAIPLAVLAAVVLGLVQVTRARRGLRLQRQAVAERLREPIDAGARRERLAHQAALARWLGELRSGQRELVNQRCEGGDWCRKRLSAVESSRRLAERLGEDAARWGLPVAAATDWHVPQQALRRELAELQSAFASLAAGPSGGAEGAPRSAVELARRRDVMQAELAYLRGALAAVP